MTTSSGQPQSATLKSRLCICSWNYCIGLKDKAIIGTKLLKNLSSICDMIFLSGSESVQVFNSLSIYICEVHCHWRSNYPEREGLDPIILWSPTIFWACHKTGLGFLSPYVMVFSMFNDLEVRGSCSFCSYCWPSLFQLSFFFQENVIFLKYVWNHLKHICQST
jgi:hypothetical protein